MSIAAMNWVWQLRLKPTVKFVLMALADACDDDGYCWPSVPTVAYKVCLDDRTVQRIFKKLKSDGLVQVQPRFRNDGSPTSNGYRLPITPPGGNSPPPLPAIHRVVVTPAPPPGGSSVTLTTTEHTNESKPLLQPYAEPTGGSCSDLIFPRQLSAKEIEIVSQKLSTIPALQAQEVLDELAGRLNAQTVRGSPLSYLRTLIARAEAGTFTPEVGIRVALSRERDKELAALKQQDSRPKLANSTNPQEHLEKLRKVLTKSNSDK